MIGASSIQAQCPRYLRMRRLREYGNNQPKVSMRSKLMAFAELWLPILGAGIFICWAVGAWYGGTRYFQFDSRSPVSFVCSFSLRFNGNTTLKHPRANRMGR